MNREPAKSFRDLIVWQKAHQLVLALYQSSATFPMCTGLLSFLMLSFRACRGIVALPVVLPENDRDPSTMLRMTNLLFPIPTAYASAILTPVLPRTASRLTRL